MRIWKNEKLRIQIDRHKYAEQLAAIQQAENQSKAAPTLNLRAIDSTT